MKCVVSPRHGCSFYAWPTRWRSAHSSSRPGACTASWPTRNWTKLWVFLHHHHHHHHHHHLSLNRESRWGTSYDFTTRFPHFSLFLAALWELGELLACPFPEVVFVFSLPAKWTNLHKIRYIHRLENAKDKFNDCFENAPLSLHQSNKTESVLWPLTFDCAKRWQMPELACHISLPRNWRTAKEMLARGKRDKKKNKRPL